MKKFFLTTLFLISLRAFPQETTDSVKLKEVVISVYPGNRSLFRTPVSLSILQKVYTKQEASLLPSLNTLPGVRMEERSPGSYRLAIRGSLLRSPFGIRNVKIYVDEFPFTDAGGNTYLNLLDAGSVSRIEVIKGPDGSLFGANTGGVLRIGLPGPADSLSGIALLGMGSYGLAHGNFFAVVKNKKFASVISLSDQMYNGYRRNSAMQRQSFYMVHSWDYLPGRRLKALFLYADLFYQTPGGLTLEQLKKDPRSARPGSKVTPGAEEQKAAVYNTSLFGGLLHEIKLSKYIQHSLAVSSMQTTFKNPFITNYEERKEGTAGMRTYFEISGFHNPVPGWKCYLGLEGQQTLSGIRNYGNIQGRKDTLQAADDMAVFQHFYFLQFTADIRRWTAEAALSLNHHRYRYKTLFPIPNPSYTARRSNAELMPRVSLSYKIARELVWRASASKGYSPPTLAEIRSSDNIIRSGLQAENGWNFESGLRFSLLNRRVSGDAVCFYYRLRDAIVRRQNSSGAEYFLNAGGTEQSGAEIQFTFLLIRENSRHLVRSLEVQGSVSRYEFFFADYILSSGDYSGNRITGVPQTVATTGFILHTHHGIYLSVQHLYTGSIPLNDANTEFAPESSVIHLKSGWKYRDGGSKMLELFFGINNLLNAAYSLGNDLNAFGGRYYNPAAGQIHFAGMQYIF